MQGTPWKRVAREGCFGDVKSDVDGYRCQEYDEQDTDQNKFVEQCRVLENWLDEIKQKSNEEVCLISDFPEIPDLKLVLFEPNFCERDELEKAFVCSCIIDKTVGGTLPEGATSEILSAMRKFRIEQTVLLLEAAGCSRETVDVYREVMKQVVLVVMYTSLRREIINKLFF